MQKREIVWNLSEMFPSTTDPSVQKAIDDLTTLTEKFAAKYRGKIKDLSAKELLECIRGYEEYLTRLDRLLNFAKLSFTANMTLPDTQSLSDRVDKMRAELERMLAFFNIELGYMICGNPGIVNEEVLRNYQHFLERFLKKIPHQLSESEEKLIIEKDQFGINAWRDLRRAWLNTRTFEVEVKGEKVEQVAKRFNMDPQLPHQIVKKVKELGKAREEDLLSLYPNDTGLVRRYCKAFLMWGPLVREGDAYKFESKLMENFICRRCIQTGHIFCDGWKKI